MVNPNFPSRSCSRGTAEQPLLRQFYRHRLPPATPAEILHLGKRSNVLLLHVKVSKLSQLNKLARDNNTASKTIEAD
ncbi:hypothetical protein KSP40_PGU001772 [Platanthera guangdongensis]|uniref:Uncharacterized protein n=1 Tax=Platanthera guangdongensis TaxID=2320717 RepID=A0ABR2MPW8_9ASPA